MLVVLVASLLLIPSNKQKVTISVPKDIIDCHLFLKVAKKSTVTMDGCFKLHVGIIDHSMIMVSVQVGKWWEGMGYLDSFSPLPPACYCKD